MARRAIAIVFVVGAFGVAGYMSIRAARSGSSTDSSNTDRILMVCGQCASVSSMTTEQLLETPRDESGARRCPKCAAMRLVHAAPPCSKCGKHLPFRPGMANCPWCKAPLGASATAPAAPDKSGDSKAPAGGSDNP